MSFLRDNFASCKYKCNTRCHFSSKGIILLIASIIFALGAYEINIIFKSQEYIDSTLLAANINFLFIMK